MLRMPPTSYGCGAVESRTVGTLAQEKGRVRATRMMMVVMEPNQLGQISFGPWNIVFNVEKPRMH